MKLTVSVVIALALSACGPSKVSTNGSNAFYKTVALSSHRALIREPQSVNTQTLKPWVWYAPSFIEGSTPGQSQHSWYFEQLNAAGITVVGVDVGESYGSPAGRAGFDELYAWMQAHGYAAQGCFIAQSRGGLQVYEWLLDGNQSKAACVLGIYPLLTLTDYVGLPGMAPAWGLTVEQMSAQLQNIDVLSRASQLNMPILHLHGIADIVTSPLVDSGFTATAGQATLMTFENLGHENYAPKFFHSVAALEFLITHTGNAQ